jgi:hypothetical protein
MTLEYFSSWFNDLMSRPDQSLRKTSTVRGECKTLGPNPRFAAVRLTLSPNNTFEIESLLDTRITSALEPGWLDEIVFGVIDIMLTRPAAPIRNFGSCSLRGATGLWERAIWAFAPQSRHEPKFQTDYSRS